MVSKGLPAGVGDWAKAISGKKEFGGEDLCDPLEMGPGRRKGSCDLLFLQS